MRGKRARICVIIVALLVFMELTGSVGVSAAPSAIVVYQHGFARGLRYTHNGHLAAVNKTSSFTQDDTIIYAYAQAAYYSVNVTWKWYNPNGILYKSTHDYSQCETTPCYLTSNLVVARTPVAVMFGRWRVDLVNENTRVFSDYFYLSPILTQDNAWSFAIEESTTAHIHGNLTVTIHPNNQTWSYYEMYMPFATNVTAFELESNNTLNVSTLSASRVIVDFGGARSDGYMFVISFDVRYGLQNLNSWSGGDYAFTWRDWPWQRLNDPHPIYETFNVTLPPSAGLIDVIGQNAMAINYDVTSGNRTSIGFDSTVINQLFGWTVIYRDLAYRNAHPNQQPLNTNGGFNLISGQRLPILPLTLGGVNLWAAVMSVFLLTASELASPLYGKSGSRILVNRKRLRIAALLLVAVFLVTTSYQILIIQQSIIPK